MEIGSNNSGVYVSTMKGKENYESFGT